MRLVLLFTYGISLDLWRRQGLIDRELSYYRHLRRAGIDDVTLFTYSPSDAGNREGAEDFRVLPRPASVGYLAYSLLGPLLRRRAFRNATIVKSNQSRGAWTGIVAKLLDRRIFFVVRCGWVRTRQMMTNDDGLSGFWLRWAEAVERRSFKSADAIFVTSPADGRYVSATYGIDESRIEVMPNAVDTVVFVPRQDAPGRAPARVIAVGRLVPMKNFEALITAAATLAVPLDLVIVGDGPHRAALEQLASQTGARVEFRSFMPNSSLPEELRAADLFVMPQLYGAGMSKVILEAMACGLVVIASDIELHRGVIEDGVNGFLCGVSAAAIGDCLQRVVTLDPTARAAIAARARRDVEARYSMRALADREVAFYRTRLAARDRARHAS